MKKIDSGMVVALLIYGMVFAIVFGLSRASTTAGRAEGLPTPAPTGSVTPYPTRPMKTQDPRTPTVTWSSPYVTWTPEPTRATEVPYPYPGPGSVLLAQPADYRVWLPGVIK